MLQVSRWVQFSSACNANIKNTLRTASSLTVGQSWSILSLFYILYYWSSVWCRCHMTMSSLCRDFPVHMLCWSDLSETAHRSVPSCTWTQSSWHHSLHFVFPPHWIGVKQHYPDTWIELSKLRVNCPPCVYSIFLPATSLLTLCFSPDAVKAFYLCHVCEERVPLNRIMSHVTSTSHNCNFFVRVQCHNVNTVSIGCFSLVCWVFFPCSLTLFWN